MGGVEFTTRLDRRSSLLGTQAVTNAPGANEHGSTSRSESLRCWNDHLDTAFSPDAQVLFNTHGVRGSPDDMGEELRDDEAAWHEATLVAGEIFNDIDGNFRPDREWSLEVSDEQGKPLYSIHIMSNK